MRILVVHSRYLSGQLSGENRVVEDETESLRAWGHEVELFVRSAQNLSRGSLAARSLASFEVAKAVRERVRASHIDIVHCHNLYPTLGPLVLPAAASAGAAVVLTLHNYRLMCLAGTLFRSGAVCEVCVGKTPWRGVVHSCYRASRLQSGVVATSITAARFRGAFAAVHRYLAISEFIRRKHVEAGLPPSRIVVKPNFVPSSGRRDGPGSYFLIVGRLSPEKGIADVVRAWSADLGELRIAGDGPERGALEQLARGRPIRFEGPLDSSEVARLLRDARAVLMPSTWFEGQPRVALEAYAAGVPLIASRIGALEELVREDQTGFTVPVGEAAPWTEAVRRLANDDLSVRLGRGAYEEWRARFSPERGRELLEATYREALEARAS
jgi:glycosyltransferase involved in cell wall biosynthesis